MEGRDRTFCSQLFASISSAFELLHSRPQFCLTTAAFAPSFLGISILRIANACFLAAPAFSNQLPECLSRLHQRARPPRTRHILAHEKLERDRARKTVLQFYRAGSAG